MELATREDYEALKAQLDEMRSALNAISAKLVMPDVLYVSDLAKIEDLSVPGIKKSPWLLPNFGESEYPGGRVRWTSKTVREWRSIPVKDRISMWETYTANKIAAYLGR